MTHRGTGSCPAGKPIKAAGFRPWGPRREQTADQAENYVRYNDAVAQCRFKTADDLSSSAAST